MKILDKGAINNYSGHSDYGLLAVTRDDNVIKPSSTLLGGYIFCSLMFGLPFGGALWELGSW
jgi:hypothetical protein